jgi:hypothetical protein
MVQAFLSLVDVFGLEDVAGIERRQEGPTLFYLFKLEGLLSVERRLAIDAQNGMTRIYCEETVEVETQLDERERCLLIACVQASPSTVPNYQMCALCQLGQKTEVPYREVDAVLMGTLRETLVTCNEKLISVGLVIRALEHEEEYQLQSIHAQPMMGAPMSSQESVPRQWPEACGF